MQSVTRHAPRERVSWNYSLDVGSIYNIVTLHVSVWVEMLMTDIKPHLSWVTLHVSVWVEISIRAWAAVKVWSRSTWACELKCRSSSSIRPLDCHAPRERVSWNGNKNVKLDIDGGHAPRERVSWNFEICNRQNQGVCHAPRERVSWNINNLITFNRVFCHAPRERVSWNSIKLGEYNSSRVTLHVSVWVEIRIHGSTARQCKVTLHVSVWVEITNKIFKVATLQVTLHVSVWVEIKIIR